MIAMYKSIILRHPVILLEDPFADDDFEPWQALFQQVSQVIEIVGDGLLATNP